MEFYKLIYAWLKRLNTVSMLDRKMMNTKGDNSNEEIISQYESYITVLKEGNEELQKLLERV